MKQHNPRIHAALLGLLWLPWATLAVPLPLHAQPSPGPARILSFSAGLFRPTDAGFRSSYGWSAPVAVQLDWPVLSRVAVFVGVRYVRPSGQAVVEADGRAATDVQDTGASAIRLSLASARVGGMLLRPAGRWLLSAGGGVVLTRYSEDWAAAGAKTTGSKTGWLVQARVSRAVGRRWLVGGGLEYAAARVRQDDEGDLVQGVQLGGFDTSVHAGVRW